MNFSPGRETKINKAKRRQTKFKTIMKKVVLHNPIYTTDLTDDMFIGVDSLNFDGIRGYVQKISEGKYAIASSDVPNSQYDLLDMHPSIPSLLNSLLSSPNESWQAFVFPSSAELNQWIAGHKQSCEKNRVVLGQMEFLSHAVDRIVFIHGGKLYVLKAVDKESKLLTVKSPTMQIRVSMDVIKETMCKEGEIILFASKEHRDEWLREGVHYHNAAKIELTDEIVNYKSLSYKEDVCVLVKGDDIIVAVKIEDGNLRVVMMSGCRIGVSDGLPKELFHDTLSDIMENTPNAEAYLVESDKELYELLK